MKLEIPKGKYVIAVSGGVDSIVLLDLLSRHKDASLIVAHIDHGIRPDASKDRLLVEKLAKDKGLIFEYLEAKLGESASEELARNTRYDFLKAALNKHKADAIITAHHQDDLIETAILNMLRGTGRKGLTALKSSEKLMRPLLNYSKQEILSYANEHKLLWNEDSTNTDIKYLRNYIRIKIIPKFSQKQKQDLLRNILDMHKINNQLDEVLAENIDKEELSRTWFNSLPHEVATEVLASWLRKAEVRDFDRKLIEKLVIGIKVAKNGKNLDVKNGAVIKVAKNTLILVK